jgi:hypothetical protein
MPVSSSTGGLDAFAVRELGVVSLIESLLRVFGGMAATANGRNTVVIKC